MSLTELSYYVRRAIPFVVLFILIIFIVFYSFKLYFVFLQNSRPVTTFTNTIFGKIDPPKFSESTTSAGFKFTLDTIEGIPVTATSTANVYFIPDTPTRFGYREKIYLMAKTFGFDTEVIKHKLDGRNAVFEDAGRKLTIDIGNFNFKYETDIKTDTFITGSVALSKNEIINKAVSFLKSVDRYPEELALGTTNVIYLKYNSQTGDFVNVDRARDASAVEVDFYRPDVGGVPVATPKFFNSQNYVVMNFKEFEPNIIRARVSFFEKSDSQVGVYPVKTGEAAWEQLNSGHGIVVAGQFGIKNVKIKKMDVYYLDPDIYQPYLQPVFVFIGDNDFVAYLPAVIDEFINR